MKVKKILAVLLALAMMLCTLNVAVFAEDTTAQTVEVQNYDELVAALENGGSIKLTSDITIEKGFAATKSATIDLNNYTFNIRVGGIDFNSPEGITVKNGTIDITGAVATGDALFGIGRRFDNGPECYLTLDGVSVVGDGYSSAYAVFYIYCGNMTVNNCTFDLANDNGVSGGVFKSDNSNNTLSITDSTLQLYNVRRVVTYTATTIENSTVTIAGDEETSAEMEHGFNRSPLTIINSSVTMENLLGRGITAECGAVTVDGTSTVTMTNCVEATIDVRSGQTVTVADTATVVLDAEPTVNDGCSISGEITVKDVIKGLSGEGTADSPYLINNVDELKWFRDDVNGGNNYSKKYVKLIADIDLNSEEWTPIGNSSNPFNGIFDGGEKTVSNLVITGNNSNVGFFGRTNSGEIKNLTVNNALVSGRLAVGAVAGTPFTSKYTNIKLTGHVEINGMAYVGGVLGRNAYANLTDIIVDVDSTSYVKADSVEDGVAYRTYVGGVVGFIGEGGHALTNITSNIKVIGSTIDVGGIAGIAHYGNKFVNVSCSGNVTLENASSFDDAQEIGGIAGVWYNQAGKTVTFEDCTYTGSLSSTYTDENGETVTLTTSNFANGGLIGDSYNEPTEDSGEMVIDYAAYIGTTMYETLAEAIAAVKDGETVNIITAGTYKLSAISNKTVAITGLVDGVVIDMSSAIALSGANVTFTNITFNYAENSTYKGLQHTAAEIYNNCTINGQMFAYGNKAEFNSCTFNQTYNDGYNIWTYGAKDIDFNNCTFNSAGKSVLIYNEGATDQDATFTACEFIASEAVEGKAAIEVDCTDSEYTVVVDDATTATGFAAGSVSGDSLWNVKKGSKETSVAVADEVVFINVLPTATVTDISAEELAEKNAPPLTFAKKFIADEASELVKAYYGDWYADFVLTLNKTATFNADESVDGYLAGEYGSYGWISVPFENVTLEAGQSLKIMEYAAELMGQKGLKITYNDVLTAVQEFNCGIFFNADYLVANPDLEVTLELRIYNPEDETESYSIGNNYSFVAPDVVAKVDNVGYSDLQSAIDAANGSTVTLIDDVYLSETAVVAESATVILDLNGYDITVGKQSDTTKSIYAIDNKGTLTIKDTTGTGSIVARGLGNYGDLTIEEGATIVACDNNGGACIWNYAGNVTINGGTFLTGEDDLDESGNSDAGLINNNNTEGTITINSGTFNSTANLCYAIINNGILEINDAEITAYHGTVANNSGTTVINDGVYTLIGVTEPTNQTDNVIYASGGSITVNGGTFESKSVSNGGSSVVCISSEGTATGKIIGGIFKGGSSNIWASADALSVSGGTFTDESAQTYVVDGFELTPNSDGTYGITEEIVEPEVTLNTAMLIVQEYVPNNYGGWGEYPNSMLFAVGIDSLDYAAGGFEITINGVTKVFEIDGTVYKSLKINDYTYIPDDFGTGYQYIMYYVVMFDDAMVEANPELSVRAFLETFDGDVLYSGSRTTTII